MGGKLEEIEGMLHLQELLAHMLLKHCKKCSRKSIIIKQKSSGFLVCSMRQSWNSDN